jgi:hypothetical protein
MASGIRTNRDIKNITKLNKMVDMGYRYFGTYTFLIIPALFRMDFAAVLVLCEKKEYIRRPHKIYIGK